MSDWNLIHDSKPVELGLCSDGQQRMFARVWVYDKGHQDILGRFVVAKLFRLPNGQVRRTQTNYCQRPAALRYVDKWLAGRKAGAPVPAAAA